MKRPVWATVVGVLGIILACLGVIGAGQDMMMPRIMAMQKQIFMEMEMHAAGSSGQEDSNWNSAADNSPPLQGAHAGQAGTSSEDKFKAMEKMWDCPPWYGTWSVASGILKLFICGLMFVASIWFLQTKPSAVQLFYWAAGLSICLSVLKGVVAVTALSLMGMSIMFGGLFGIVIHLVLILVVAMGDKEAFALESVSPIRADIMGSHP